MHPTDAGAASLRTAAARLRAAPPTGTQHAAQVFAATARLLEQLAAGVAYDDPGLPAYVRRAALALAARVATPGRADLGSGADLRPGSQGARRAPEVPLPRTRPRREAVGAGARVAGGG